MSLIAAPLVSLAAALSCLPALDVVVDVVSGSLQCLLPFLGMHEAKDPSDARPRLGWTFAKLRCNVKAL